MDVELDRVQLSEIYPGDGKVPSGEIGELIEREVRQIGIPPCPKILIQIRREMEHEEPSYQLLSSIISADVAISASLIKTANSPGVGLLTRVRSVNEALMALGLQITGYTVAHFALQKLFPNTPSLERFWGFSTRVAQISAWLARRVGDVRPDDAYTFGLFRDCGIPVLMIPFKAEYPAILSQANNEASRRFTDVEDELVGINHASVGADLAESWLLPKDMTTAIRHHHSLEALKAGSPLTDLEKRLIALSHLAEHLIQVHTSLSHTEEWKKLGPDCLAYLDISLEQLEKLKANSQEAMVNER